MDDTEAAGVAEDEDEDAEPPTADFFRDDETEDLITPACWGVGSNGGATTGGNGGMVTTPGMDNGLRRTSKGAAWRRFMPRPPRPPRPPWLRVDILTLARYVVETFKS